MPNSAHQPVRRVRRPTSVEEPVPVCRGVRPRGAEVFGNSMGPVKHRRDVRASRGRHPGTCCHPRPRLLRLTRLRSLRAAKHADSSNRERRCAPRSPVWSPLERPCVGRDRSRTRPLRRRVRRDAKPRCPGTSARASSGERPPILRRPIAEPKLGVSSSPLARHRAGARCHEIRAMLTRGRCSRGARCRRTP